MVNSDFIQRGEHYYWRRYSMMSMIKNQGKSITQENHGSKNGVYEWCRLHFYHNCRIENT